MPWKPPHPYERIDHWLTERQVIPLQGPPDKPRCQIHLVPYNHQYEQHCEYLAELQTQIELSTQEISEKAMSVEQNIQSCIEQVPHVYSSLFVLAETSVWPDCKSFGFIAESNVYRIKSTNK